MTAISKNARTIPNIGWSLNILITISINFIAEYYYKCKHSINKWYNSLKLQGGIVSNNPLKYPHNKFTGVIKHMSTFIDIPDWYGYSIKARPTSFIRRIIKYHRWYLPFMDGDKIYLTLTIIVPDNHFKNDKVRYSWIFKDIENGNEMGSGNISINIKKQKTKIESKLILEPSKYRLELQLIKDDIAPKSFQTIALIPVKERGDVTFQYAIPAILATIAILGSLISVIISIIALCE